MAKVCSSAFVDSRFGCDQTAELNNSDRKFATIGGAIQQISKKKNPSLSNRWVVFLSPCSFKEDVILEAFIDLHGEDRLASIIMGNVFGQHLTQTSDQVEIKELTIKGSILKNNSSKGFLSAFEVTLITSDAESLFKIEAGTVRIDSCLLQQTVVCKEKNNIKFYHVRGTEFVDLNIRNCRHTRTTLSPTNHGQIFSNILYANSNENSLVSFQSNLFSNNFVEHFHGLLIPYLTSNASGSFQSHSDTLNHRFSEGAGDRLKFPAPGVTYTNAFILARKLPASGKELKFRIHTTEIMGLPERTLNTFASAHSATIDKVKTKHVAFHGFREIPDVLEITAEPDTITVLRPSNERSMIGNASDAKLFSSRVVVSTLLISAANFPPVPPDNPQGPTVSIPDNVGVVDLEESAVLIIPISANPTIGQQITFNFLNGTFFGITGSADPNNPPSGPLQVIIRDARASSRAAVGFVVYSLLDLTPPRNLYPNVSLVNVRNTVGVTLTLTGAVQNPNGTLVVTFTATSISGQSRIIGPGSTNLNVPPGTTTVRINLWGAGGSGGQFTTSQLGSIVSYISASGGASGSTILYSADATNLRGINLIIPPATTATASNGGDATINLAYSDRFDLFTAKGGGAGQGGTSAPGGSGQGFSFVYQGQSTTPPSNFVGVNGASGGASGPQVLGPGIVTGEAGENNPASGQPGGNGGAGSWSQEAGVPPSLNASGGGGGGYEGPGGSGIKFRIQGFVFNFQVVNQGTTGPPTGSGGGGAGQDPINVPSQTNGGPGGALITFL